MKENLQTLSQETIGLLKNIKKVLLWILTKKDITDENLKNTGFATFIIIMLLLASIVFSSFVITGIVINIAKPVFNNFMQGDNYNSGIIIEEHKQSNEELEENESDNTEKVETKVVEEQGEALEKAKTSGIEVLANNSSILGDYAIVSSSYIVKTKTGTGPFDEDDDPGNDSSEDNNIVRSFDQVTWTIDNIMKIKDGIGEKAFYGGDLCIEAKIPEECANVMKWDLESMNWLEGTGELSSDGRIFTGKYHMSEEEITVPGQQSLQLILKIDGAGNGIEIIPEFKIWIDGNTEKEKIIITGEKVIISAAPKYNIELVQNSYLSNKVTVDYGQGDTIGRMYGYGLILELYNENESKGLKGIEYPKGEISFDINLELKRSKLGTSDLEDITSECTPILWNYKINKETNYGNIENRIMFFGSDSNRYIRNAPLRN